MSRHALPSNMHGIWKQMERDYRASSAHMQLASVSGIATDEQADAYTSAVDAILLTPAEAEADIRLKIEVMRDHEVMDGWWCATEAVALLAIDSTRILSPNREGGAA